MLKLISTPFPYASGFFHVGTLSQIIRADTCSKMINAFENNAVFDFSLHLTGLPIKIVLDEINSGTAYGLKIKNHFKLKAPVSVQDWYASTKNEMNNLIRTLGCDTSVSHTTTSIDDGYNRYVNMLYNELDARKKLKMTTMPAIVCTAQKTVCGDHERKKGQGLGVTYTPVYSHYRHGKKYFSKSSSNAQWYVKQNVHVCSKLYNLLDNGDFMLANINFGDALSVIEPLQNMQQDVLHTCSNKIVCRCGSGTEIQSVATVVIDFSKQWIEKCVAHIEQSRNQESIKSTLIQAVRNMRPISFLRPRGLGTKLDVLKNTDFKDYVVDPLNDSFLHPFYYMYTNSNTVCNGTFKQFMDLKKHYTHQLHVTAHDLINNHLALYCLLSTQLLNKLEPYFFVNGFLVDKDNLKMSKSIGNVLLWDDIKQYCSPRGFRFFISTLSDTMAAQQITAEKLIEAEKNSLKHSSSLKKILDSAYCDEKVEQCLNNIRQLLGLSAKKQTHEFFKLRKIHHLLFYELRAKLEGATKNVEAHANLRNCIIKLLKVYTND